MSLIVSQMTIIIALIAKIYCLLAMYKLPSTFYERVISHMFLPAKPMESEL